MEEKERLYCIIVYFENMETTYYGFNKDILMLFKDLLNKIKLPYKVYLQIDKNKDIDNVTISEAGQLLCDFIDYVNLKKGHKVGIGSFLINDFLDKRFGGE